MNNDPGYSLYDLVEVFTRLAELETNMAYMKEFRDEFREFRKELSSKYRWMIGIVVLCAMSLIATGANVFVTIASKPKPEIISRLQFPQQLH